MKSKVNDIKVCEGCGYPFIVGNIVCELEVMGRMVVCCAKCRRDIAEADL